jgi:Fe2+ transport protein
MRTIALPALLAAGVVGVGACGSESQQQSQAKSQPASEDTASTSVPKGVTSDYETREHEIREAGGQTKSGPWRIGYIVEAPEGWFEQHGDDFEWRAPTNDETNHVEILPIEDKTGRLMPNVPITLEILDEQGERVDRKELSPYYSEFLHYANNFAVPRAGEYTLRATIEPPEVRRHGEENEPPPMAEGAEVEFENVRLGPERS